MWRVVLASLAAAWCLALASSPAWADDPYLRWWTLETPHFIIHYHDQEEALSQRVAVYSEQAHAILSVALGRSPSEKTHIVLDDTQDTANGFANVLPRNAIRLYAYGPEARSVLGDYDDWLRLLILHEYVHVLHIDTISGVPELINAVFGKIFAPNQLLPRWYIEGLATWRESLHTGGGRIRSSLFGMYLRVAWLEGAFFDLDRLSGIPVFWPRGSNWYLYGSHFLDYVTRTRGEGWMRAYHEAIGDDLLPYGVNNTLRELIGEDFVGLYEEWRAHLAGRFEAEALRLRLEGLTPVERLTFKGNVIDTPRVRPGRREVTFYKNDGFEDPCIFSHALDTGAIRCVVEVDGGGGPHGWDATGRYAIYHASRFHLRAYAYNELLLHDAQTGEITPLTRGGRARDPDMAPSGRGVVYVEAGQGQTRLVWMDRVTRARRVLWRFEGLGQLDGPRFSPDGRYVVVSAWVPGSGRDLYLVHVESGRRVRLTADDALDIEPSFSPEGDRVVFSSDRTGIYDIYEVDLGEVLKQAPEALPEAASPPVRRLTRVLGGLFAPQIVQDGARRWLYVATYGKDGLDLGRIDMATGVLPAAAAPASRVRPVVEYPAVSAAEVIEAEEPYQAWRYLAPLTAFPLLAFTNSGRDSYGLELLGYDPVGLHTWSAVGEYFPESESALALGSYTYRGWPLDLAVGAQYSSYERGRGYVRQSRFVPYEEEAWDGQLTLGLPVRDQTHIHYFSLSYNLRMTDVVKLPELAHDPSDVTPRDPEAGNFSSVFLAYTVSSTNSYVYSVQPEEGGRLNLSLRFRNGLTGADVSSVEARYNAALYLSNPWLDSHVLSLRGSGGIGRSDYLRQELYTIGGAPSQEPLTALLNNTPLGGDYLRGFLPFAFAGEQFHTGTVEYRFPVWNIEAGFDTLPFYIGRLSLGAFSDVGAAFNGPFEDATWHGSVGAEARLTLTLGYTLPSVLTLGYAHGFGGEGIEDIYFFVGQTY